MAGVLVVDDSAETRALAADTLADEGIAVAFAATGEEALAQFARVAPDALLLDINLPGMDGVAVCERIRALPGGERVAIVFVTARRDVETFDRALRAGGDDFLTKPFRPAELLVRVGTARRLRDMAVERSALSLELKAQRDELQRVHLQREQLTQFLVHDLKNPVGAIELLARRVAADGGEKTAASAAKIREEARGLMRMLTNLLDVSKAQEGQLVAARRRVDVRALVTAAIGELSASAAAAGVTLVADVEVAAAELDRDLMLRVLANLIENAIRHAPEGTTVTVSARPGLALCVADGGPGVAAPLREAVFDRFATAGPRGSHGLGLAFCRVALAAHGGRIWIEDGAPGARVCMELPHA